MSSVTTLPRCPICGLEHAGGLPGRCARATCGVELLPGTAERLGVRTFRLTSHFSLCVLPFSFAEPEGLPIWLRLAGSGRWTERRFSLADPDDVERTEYFLPYIRRFLFPGLWAAEGPAASKPGRPPQSCWHFNFDLARLGQAGKDGLPLSLHVRDNQKKLGCTYELVLEKVELIVFTYRVGFLVLHFHNSGPGATFFDQMHALSYLRTIAPLYQGFELPELAAGQQRFRMTQLLPYLLAEFAGGPAPESPATIPADAPLPVQPTYDDRMMIYTFSCIDRETALPEQGRVEALLRRAAVIPFARDAASRPEEAGEDAARDALAARWQSYSKDGGSLVVFNTDRFHARFLGAYHRTYYFDIFLLAALQRVTLLTLFESFSDIHTLITGSGASRKLLRRVRRDLLLFKNQCWFSQITNRERGLVLWKRWQKVFETRTLLREVNEQSEELNNYLQARYRERIEWLVKLGGFLAAVVPVILGLERFLGQQSWVSSLRWVLLGVVAAGAAVFGWYVLFKQRDEG